MTKIIVLHGTRRTGNLSISIARFFQEELSARQDVDSHLISLMDYNLPLMEDRAPLTLPEGLPEIFSALTEADGVLIVTPEYKNSLPAALKNLFDFLPVGHLKRKSTAFVTVSSGGFGGLDCLAHLRMIMSTLGGVALPSRFPVSHVKELLDPQGALLDTEAMRLKSAGFMEEFLWLTRALAAAK